MQVSRPKIHACLWLVGMAMILLFLTRPVYAQTRSAHWYSDSLSFVVARGLFSEVPSDAPMVTVTRAQAAAALYRHAGTPQAVGPDLFSDVAPGACYADAVTWAADSGLTTGTAPDRFSPDAAITRQELVTMLYRYAGSPPVEAPLAGFQDTGTVSDWALDAMAWGVSECLVSGTTPVTLSPRSAVNFSEAAVLLTRFSTAVIA